MPVKVTDYISTTAPSDTYPTHDSLMGKGGYREVASLVARNAIPSARRREGMLVYVIETGLVYKLGSDLSNWFEFTSGSGSGDLNYLHNQMVPNSVWTITHGLGKFPSVSVMDSAKNTVIGDVRYIDLNSLTVTFSASFAGKATLN